MRSVRVRGKALGLQPAPSAVRCDSFVCVIDKKKDDVNDDSSSEDFSENQLSETNEARKVSKTMDGRPDKIVEEILTGDDSVIKSEKDVFTTPCQNNTKIHPNGKSPFSIINSLCNGSLSAAKSNKKGNDSSETTTKEKSLGGSAGYVFFENRKGYHFKSIDALCDTKGEFGGVGTIRTFIDSADDGVSEGTSKVP